MSTAIAAPVELSDAEWLRSRLDGPMNAGSILVHAGSAAFQAPGGGEVQLLRTARELERLGHALRPFEPWMDRVRDARLLHIFGLSREGLELARIARGRGVPVVVSSICWVDPAAMFTLAPTIPAGLLDAAKWTAKRLVPRAGFRSRLLRLADAVLPNSQAEARQLVRLFGVDPRRICVVPNGVEERFAGADPGVVRGALPRGDFVLYVGRVEPRKGILGLVRACRLSGLRLVVLGDPVPGHEAYAESCFAEAGRSLVRIPRMAHDDPRLPSIFSAASVFALPSRFETPGLAALEAALAGVPVVITPHGCTREYFGDHVEYARPDRPREIASALRNALRNGPSAGLGRIIRSGYLWSAVARRTAEVYDAVSP